MAKLMISIRDENYRLITLEARSRGITVQELIRAVTLPDWIRANDIGGPGRGNDPLRHTPVSQRENEIQSIISRQWPQKSLVGK